MDFNNYSYDWHAKDVIMSFDVDGSRQSVSILNSLNTHAGSMNYQVNSILEIHENHETGHLFYDSFRDLITHPYETLS